MSTSTAIALYSDTKILTDLVKKQKEVAICDHCGNSLVGKDSFVICRAPDVSTPGNTRHKAHTACFECADNLSYIGDAGACAPCLEQFGSRRSMAKFAGVALRPPVKNVIADSMISGLTSAEESIQEANNRKELERIQEGEDRRAQAVEEKRRRQEEESERKAEETRLEAERKAEETRLRAEKKAEETRLEAERKAEETRLEAERKAEETRLEAEKRAKEEIAEYRTSAEKEVQMRKSRAMLEIEEVKRKMSLEAAASRARDEQKRMEEQQEALPMPSEEAPRKRTRRPPDPEAVRKRAETARIKREKLEKYDTLLSENSLALLKVDELMNLYRTNILANLENGEEVWERLEAEVQERFAEMEESFQEGEEEEEE